VSGTNQLDDVRRIRRGVVAQAKPAAAVLSRALTDARLDLGSSPGSWPGSWALAADDLAAAALGWIRTSKVLSAGLGPPTAMRVLPTLPASFAHLEFAEIPRMAVGPIARGLAAAVLLSATEGWNAGRVLRDRVSISPSLPRRLAELERRGHAVLRRSWRAARSGDARALPSICAELVELVAELPSVCADAAAAPSAAQVAADGFGLRASRVARELALWMAALPLLITRLHDQRLRETTQKLATRRTVLERMDGPPGRAMTQVPPLPFGRPATVVGVVRETGWVERPDDPYAWARLERGGVLVLPHKRFRTRGVVEGSVVWARGRVKPEFADLGHVLEVEAEGPGSHASTVWADWLAVTLRGALDIAPGSLRMWWELPDPRSSWANRDLSAHLPHQEVK
jgi:hypothetical protein